MPTSSTPLLMTIAQTASHLGKPKSTLYAWANSGELPGAVQVRSHWYVRRDALDLWLKGQEVASAPDR